MQSSCLYIFHSFYCRNVFLLTILKGLKPFWLQVKTWTWNWIKELLALEFCKNQNKVISILHGTHINHDQIHQIRNNWLGSNFFSLGTVTHKGFVLLHLGPEVDTNPKGRLVSFKFTPSNDRVLYFHAPQGIAPGNSWTGGVSSKDYKMENEDKGNENK